MLPLDVLVLIAKTDLSTYRCMLAIPRFARYTLESNVVFRRHFTIKKVKTNGGTTSRPRTTIVYKLNGLRHREDDKPAVITTGDLEYKYWYRFGNLHRDNDQPAMVYDSGKKIWCNNGKIHRDNDQPAEVWGDEQIWYQDGIIHRDNDKPALVLEDGSQMWFQYGKRHRNNDQPAIIWCNGINEWWQNDKRHRDDDHPAIIYLNQRSEIVHQEWYYNDTQYYPAI